MKAASIEGDMRIGAMIGGGTQEEIEALASYGRILGTLAILREEFVDVFDVGELNQRLSSEYLPIPVLYALHDPESKKKIEKLITKNITERDINVLVDIVFETKEVENINRYAEKLVVNAVHTTSNISNKDLRYQLESLAFSTLEDI